MRYSCVKQLDETDCAAACISTVCEKYGVRKSVTKIREMAGTDKNGTNGIGVIKALNELGFDAQAFLVEDKKLNDNTINYPCIAHVNKYGLNHYVVIHALQNGRLIVADPAEGICEYSEAIFNEIWTGVIFCMFPTDKLKTVEKDKKNISIFNLLSQQKGLIASIVLFSFLFTLFGIASTVFFQIIFDSVIPKNKIEMLGKIAIGFIGIAVLGGIVQYIRVRLILLLGKRYDMELTYNSYAHIIHLPMNFFSSRQTGEIISRLNDSSKIRDALSGATISVVVDVFMASVSAFVLAQYSLRLSTVVYISFLLYVGVNLLFIKKIRENNRENLENASRTNAMFIETIKGVETIKACGAEETVCKESKTMFISLLDTVIASQKTESVLNIISSIISRCCYIAVLWMGAKMVIGGQLSTGVLLTFYSLIGYFFSPVQSLMSLQASMQGAVVAYDRLNQMLECEKEKIDASYEGIPLKGMIEVKNISFRYGSRKKVLDGISFTVGQNEKIAIVGESGSGKTTIARLLLGFYEYEAGDIILDGKAMKEIDKGWIRKQMAYVPQEPYFFKGTLKENVLFGNSKNISDEDIKSILRIVKLDKFIEESPEGIYSKLQENATNLSGGQRQRLSIARALIKKPQILILDEATSNLDVVTEKSITEAIDSIHTMTIIVIAHRLTTIKHCDRIIVMKDGRVEESGTHLELMNQNGYYKGLWKEVEG